MTNKTATKHSNGRKTTTSPLDILLKEILANPTRSAAARRERDEAQRLLDNHAAALLQQALRAPLFPAKSGDLRPADTVDERKIAIQITQELDPTYQQLLRDFHDAETDYQTTTATADAHKTAVKLISATRDSAAE